MSDITTVQLNKSVVKALKILNNIKRNLRNVLELRGVHVIISFLSDKDIYILSF